MPWLFSVSLWQRLTAMCCGTTRTEWLVTFVTFVSLWLSPLLLAQRAVTVAGLVAGE